MNPIQQNWVNFNTHFHTAHRESEETGELTIEYAGYHQANLVKDIVAHISGISFTCPTQDPECTPIPNPAPTILTTVQPTAVGNIATDKSNILPQLMTSMQNMQQLLIQMQTNQIGGRRQTSNRNTRTYQSETELR